MWNFRHLGSYETRDFFLIKCSLFVMFTNQPFWRLNPFKHTCKPNITKGINYRNVYCPYLELFWSKSGKIRIKITRNTDNFHAVWELIFISSNLHQAEGFFAKYWSLNASREFIFGDFIFSLIFFFHCFFFSSFTFSLWKWNFSFTQLYVYLWLHRKRE